MSDLEIMKIILESKEEGYCELVNRYTNYVYTIVRSVIRGCGNKEDIEECVSDVFVKLVMDTSWIDLNRTSLKSYIGVTARNTAVNVYHKLSGRSRYISDEEIPDKILPLPSPEDKITGNELKVLFWENVKLLGVPDSEILIAQYLYNIPVKEIAVSLNMSTAAVNKRSIRARKKLEKIFSEQIDNGIIRKEDFYETS